MKDTMWLPVGLGILVLLCGSPALGQRNKIPPNPIEKIPSQPNLDLKKFAGKWYLLSVASECDYLKLNNHRLEATIMEVSRSTKPQELENLFVRTFRKLDGICWEIKHQYRKNKVPGRFTLKARGPENRMDVVVGETDYENYAIMYYQRQRRITIKLYGRRTTIGDEIYQKLDERVSSQGIDLQYIYPFPAYGFCEKADEFHILDETSR
ncbi:complement component C8 gamma chain [Spea bombifrons]|uniref:complement component C8 gamma chain n=1 Tax=Spea bombifrons TaxID=233779 RepID=UPI00234B9501|nr:complement component C8 gamma chain [Spea bombifrons]